MSKRSVQDKINDLENHKKTIDAEISAYKALCSKYKNLTLNGKGIIFFKIKDHKNSELLANATGVKIKYTSGQKNYMYYAVIVVEEVIEGKKFVLESSTNIPLFKMNGRRYHYANGGYQINKEIQKIENFQNKFKKIGANQKAITDAVLQTVNLIRENQLQIPATAIVPKSFKNYLLLS